MHAIHLWLEQRGSFLTYGTCHVWLFFQRCNRLVAGVVCAVKWAGIDARIPQLKKVALPSRPVKMSDQFTYVLIFSRWSITRFGHNGGVTSNGVDAVVQEEIISDSRRSWCHLEESAKWVNFHSIVFYWLQIPASSLLLFASARIT